MYENSTEILDLSRPSSWGFLGINMGCIPIYHQHHHLSDDLFCRYVNATTGTEWTYSKASSSTDAHC